MKKINLKEKAHFHLTGSTALTEAGFKRFKTKELELIKNVSPNVYRLARESSGIQAHFMTDSKIIKVFMTCDRVPNMSNMVAVGQMGVDLYVYNEKTNDYQLCGVGRPLLNNKSYDGVLVEFDNKEMRKFILNFPLYAEVKKASLAFSKDSEVLPLKEEKKKIMMYGTSILQGASASRPGLAYANILSRRLNVEILNYGFSGSALNEIEISKILSKREVDLFIIDSEANSGEGHLINRLEEFLKIFKKHQPNTKVIVVNRIPFLGDYYSKKEYTNKQRHEDFLLDFKEKHEDIIYVDVYSKLVNDLEITIDGVHPNDYGMMKLAEIFEKIIKKHL